MSYHSYCFLKNLPQSYLDWLKLEHRLKLLVSIDWFMKFHSIASLVQLQLICNMLSCSVFDISQVISGYREAEKSSWHSEVSLSVVHRIRKVTFCCCVTTFNITTASTTCTAPGEGWVSFNMSVLCSFLDHLFNSPCAVEYQMMYHVHFLKVGLVYTRQQESSNLNANLNISHNIIYK